MSHLFFCVFVFNNPKIQSRADLVSGRKFQLAGRPSWISSEALSSPECKYPSMRAAAQLTAVSMSCTTTRFM